MISRTRGSNLWLDDFCFLCGPVSLSTDYFGTEAAAKKLIRVCIELSLYNQIFDRLCDQEVTNIDNVFVLLLKENAERSEHMLHFHYDMLHFH